MNLNCPPASNELEISIIGPGYGECIIIHLGGERWLIVDSCIDVFTREPAALAYFKKIQVNPADSVKQVIATHWHDDHIRGFADTFEACSSAQLVLSEALKLDEMLQLVSEGTRTMVNSSGVNELHDVVKILLDRKKKKVPNDVPVFAVQGNRIWDSSVQILGSTTARCEIFSLSPSHSAILASKIEFAKLLPDIAKRPKRWVRSIDPNHAAVAIRLQIGSFSVLLGADLEEDGNPQTGWSAVISSYSPQDGKSSMFKVPHHGSNTGHHPKVWEEMLAGEPIAVLTPFQMAGTNLPTKEDVCRLKQLTPNCFITARPGKRTVKRDHAVEKMIKEVAKSISVLDALSGQVRIRFKTADFATIELFGDARILDLPAEQTYVSHKKSKHK